MKPTIATLATRYSVSVRTVKRWKAAGIDIYDARAVKRHREQAQPNGLSESAATAGTVAPSRPDKAQPDYYEARARWKHYQAVRAKLDAEKAAGSMLSAEAVASDVIRIGSICRASFMALADTLPPALEGVTARQAGKLLREGVAGVLERLERDFAALTR